MMDEGNRGNELYISRNKKNILNNVKIIFVIYSTNIYF